MLTCKREVQRTRIRGIYKPRHLRLQLRVSRLHFSGMLTCKRKVQRTRIHRLHELRRAHLQLDVCRLELSRHCREVQLACIGSLGGGVGTLFQCRNSRLRRRKVQRTRIHRLHELRRAHLQLDVCRLELSRHCREVQLACIGSLGGGVGALFQCRNSRLPHASHGAQRDVSRLGAARRAVRFVNLQCQRL